MPKRSIHGAELAYEVHGSAGDPVALIHGSLVDRHSWDRIVPGLAQVMEVVTYDRRGHGESASAPRPHPVRDDAADLAALLEELNIYPAHIVAHSYGGAVALRLAIDRPEMVRSLSIHETPFIGLLCDDPATATEGEHLRAGAEELRALVRSGQPALAARRLVQIFSAEPGAWGRLTPEVQRIFTRTVHRWAEEFDDPDAFLPDVAGSREIMVPTLLTVGAQSPGFLHRITADLGLLLRNSETLEIPGVGHAPHQARPQQYVGLLLTFLLERNVPTG
jgi:pimeloyl-ACP methyl ester carboxylesterase